METNAATPSGRDLMWSEDRFRKQSSHHQSSGRLLFNPEQKLSPSRIPVQEKPPHAPRNGRESKSGGVRFTLPVADESTAEVLHVVPDDYGKKKLSVCLAAFIAVVFRSSD